MKNRSHLSEPGIRQGLMDDIFGCRCSLCGQRSKNVDTISWTVRPSKSEQLRGYYDEAKFYRFHRGCIRWTLMEPEKHSPARIEMALTIAAKLRLRKAKQRAYDLFTLKSKVETVKEKEKKREECATALRNFADYERDL